MRKDLLASLTAKVVAGVAATAIAAGSAGAVVVTQNISDDDTPPAGTPAEDVLEDNEHSNALTHAAGDDDEDGGDELGDELEVLDEDIDTGTAGGGNPTHNDWEGEKNFGQWVRTQEAEDREPGDIADEAHEKNAERTQDAGAGGNSADHRQDDSED